MDDANPGFFAWVREHLPDPGTAMVHAAALVIISGFAAMIWEIVQPNPIRSAEIVSIKPASRVVDRSKGEFLTIQRRVCASRPVSARLIRQWIDDSGGVLGVLDDWVALDEGCKDRQPVHVHPPPSLGEGIHRYRTVLQWCSALKCRDYHLSDIEVAIVGHRAPFSRAPDENRF